MHHDSACCSTKKILCVPDRSGRRRLDSGSCWSPPSYLHVRISSGPLYLQQISLQTVLNLLRSTSLIQPRLLCATQILQTGLAIIKYRTQQTHLVREIDVSVREVLTWSSVTSHIPDCTNMRLQVHTLTPGQRWQLVSVSIKATHNAVCIFLIQQIFSGS